MKSVQDIIVRPIITEASMMMAQDKKYVFEVQKGATKSEVKTAVETMFKGVEVLSVNTINMKKKPKRIGRPFRIYKNLEKGHCNAETAVQDHRVLRRNDVKKEA